MQQSARYADRKLRGRPEHAHRGRNLLTNTSTKRRIALLAPTYLISVSNDRTIFLLMSLVELRQQLSRESSALHQHKISLRSVTDLLQQNSKLSALHDSPIDGQTTQFRRYKMVKHG